MSVGEIFGEDLWRDVAKDLRFFGAKWWQENKDALVGLSRDEVYDIAHALKAGNRRKAKQALVQRLSHDELYAYIHGTTEQLEGLAARRVAAIAAVKKVGLIAMRVVGTAILGVL